MPYDALDRVELPKTLHKCFSPSIWLALYQSYPAACQLSFQIREERSGTSFKSRSHTCNQLQLSRVSEDHFRNKPITKTIFQPPSCSETEGQNGLADFQSHSSAKMTQTYLLRRPLPALLQTLECFSFKGTD